MALAANAALAVAMPEDLSLVVKSAAELYDNAIVAIEVATGKIKPYAAASGEIPIGIHVGRKTGVAAGTVEGAIDGRAKRLPKVTVTGAEAITDVGKPVFRASDDPNTLTLTRGGMPFGFVSYWHSGTTCDVVQISATELFALALAGNGVENKLLASVGCTGAAGNMQTGIVLKGHGKITSFYGIVDVKATDADVDIDINLEIGGTNVTGGVVEWLFSDAIGAKKAGTAITGLNEFHDGDLLDIEAVYNAAGTATDIGRMNLFAVIEYLPGL